MGDSRGCRGGLRRGLRRCRAAPLPLVVLPPDGVSALRYARGPVRRNGGPRPHRHAPNRSRRPRFADGGVRWGKACAPTAGFRCAPVPCCAVSRGSGGERPLRQPAIPFKVVAVGSSGPLRRRPFASLALRAAKVGACSSGLWPPRRCGAPLAPARPRFWPRGGAPFFSLRRVLGLRRLRALKIYRAARCAIRCVYMASP